MISSLELWCAGPDVRVVACDAVPQAPTIYVRLNLVIIFVHMRWRNHMG